MTITWETNVNEIVWESQTAPGITWTTVVGGTSSGGGVTVHNDLSGRSAADAHPMSAITDLEPALTDIATAVQAQQGDIGTLQTAVAGKQAADADLTAIAALAPADDALIQRKAGAWTSRTPAQVKADMSIGVGDVSGLDENTRDVIGTALVAGSGVAVTVDDPGNTITIAVSGVVADAINDGTTTVAPSQNAVFDALALKGNVTELAAIADRAAILPAVGEWFTPPFATMYSHTCSGLNDLVFIPVVIPSNVSSIDRITVEVTSSTASATVRLGLYSPDSINKPDALLVDGGTVACTSPGFYSVTISQAVTARGLLYVGVASQGATPSVRQAATGIMLKGSPIPSSTASEVFVRTETLGWRQTGVSGSLPNPAVPVRAAAADIQPIVALRRA